MASARGARSAPAEKPDYAVPLLRLTTDDVAELERTRIAQRREELALSADEVLEKLSALHRFAEWAHMYNPAR